MEHVDAIVIGAGQAGVPLATRLAARGRSVALFERAYPGGTCVNTGCTPTKAMIASAEAAHAVRRAASLGVRAGPPDVRLDEIVARKERLVREWRSDVERNIEGAGERLVLVRSHARFIAPGRIGAGDRFWTADTIILNPGARPREPEIPGLDDVPWLDNGSVMELREIPEHLIVLGGGYVGCELGQAFRRFGSEVTIADRGPHLLAREDEEVSETLEAAFREEGIDLRLRAAPAAVESDGTNGVRLRLEDGSEVVGSHLLVAVGRRPNTDDLGCEEGGIELADDGTIVIDDHYRTSVDGVYAVGDAAGGPQFTHASWDDHRILFDLLTGQGERTRADRLVPQVVFTDPQVARVGLSEREARACGIPHEVATLPFEAIARARETGRTAGLLKVLVDPGSDRILGAVVVGDQAGELVHVYAALMAAGASVRVLLRMEMAHPTFAEGLQTVITKLDGHGLD